MEAQLENRENALDTPSKKVPLSQLICPLLPSYSLRKLYIFQEFMLIDVFSLNLIVGV